MKFRIEKKIFEEFSEPFIGVVVARGVNNEEDYPDIADLLRKVEENLRSQLNLETIGEHPHIAPWRADYRSSIEALSRIVLRGNNIRNISKLVDLYNFISIKYLLPLGGEDLDTMKGDLVLGFASGDEDYTPLAGDRTKITKQTKNVILVVESLSPISEKLARQATEELAELVKKYCGGSTKVFYLNKDNPEVDF